MDEEERIKAKDKLAWWIDALTGTSHAPKLERWRDEVKLVAKMDREAGREIGAYVEAFARIEAFFRARIDGKGYATQTHHEE